MHILHRLRFAFIARFIAVAAVLCLLGVQQAAAFHGLTHLADDGSAGSQKHLPHAKTCDKCMVFAEVSGAGPTTAHPAIQVDSPFFVIATATRFSVPSPTLPAYSARGPPISV